MRGWWHRRKGWQRAALALGAALSLWYALCLPRRLFDQPTSSVTVDRSGRLLGARIAADGQWRFPPSDTVPEKFAACVTEFEDRYFRWHPGVNPLAVARAARQNLRAGRVVSGGSTITMQVVRLSRSRPRTMGEKIVEAIMATRLELSRSKGRILALYASHAPFGGNVVGLGAASWRYFGHNPSQLSWAEAATLAVLPNAPSMVHPGRNREALRDKRDRLLERLMRRGIIEEGAFRLAVEEPLPGEPLPLPSLAPHLVARMAAERPGKYCRTTVDEPLQRAVEEVLARNSAEFSRSGIRNMAAVVIDVEAGTVAAYCGNVGFDDPASGGQVDVVRAPRSSGSILKPLLYCAMLQEGMILPRTLLPDVPVNINGFAPHNFSPEYDGAVPAAEALARSLNVPSVEMLRRYGVPAFLDLLGRAGLSTLTRPADHYGLSLILGGGDVTLWDVASAYYLLARSFADIDCAPPALSRDERGKRRTIPFDRAAAWQTLEAIKELGRPEQIDWRDIPSMQTIGWKTGTSYGFRDGWAVGVTPRHVVGVWVGNCSGEGRASLTGASTAGPVMFDIFNLLPSGRWFDPPAEDMARAAVCRRSGMLAGRFCEEVDTLPLHPAGMRSEVCPYHVPVNLTEDEKWRIDLSDEGAAGMVSRNWFSLPPAWEWYYRQRHPSYRPLPPPRTPRADSRPLQFIYPQPGARVTLAARGGERNPLVMRAAHTYPRALIFWHLDGDYAGTTVDFHQWAASPAPGRHTVTIVDEQGNSASVSFTVE